MRTLTLTISQFNTFVKNIFDAEEFLHNISVFGEVTNFKISGGNAYFDLKDENAMLSCVKFGASDLDIKNGDLVTAFGKVNFYVKSGRLNFIASKCQKAGLGDLYQKFLQLKEALEKEGLFRQEIKKEIPKFAKRIGVVTSETGAVIRDIINVTRKKNPVVDIVVYPSKVQGVGAELEIAKGIEYFDKQEDIDTIIVARGGGSFEDLAPFNTEVVARAVFVAQKPIISAVGHETDFSICDFAADLRVPTPSVAAEVAVFDYYQINDFVLSLKDVNFEILKQKTTNIKQNLKSASELISAKTKLKMQEFIAQTKSLLMKISDKVKEKDTEKKNQLKVLIEVLTKLNPLEILKSGYAFIEKDGKNISSINSLKENDELKIRVADGIVYANVIKTEEVK